MRSIVTHGVEIPEAMIAREAQNHPGASGADAWANASHALAVRALLLYRAWELGLAAEPETDAAGREETEEEALIRMVLESDVEVRPPTQAECRRVYDNRPPHLRDVAFEALEPQILTNLEGRAWTNAAARYVADLADQAREEGIALSLATEGVRRGSLTLGDFLSDEAHSAEVAPWLAEHDPELGVRLAKAAAAADQSVDRFVRDAAGAFVDEADDERWTTLISAVQSAPDPGLAAIAHLLRSKLEPAKPRYTIFRRA
ncbi:MAG: hypothetical protein U1E50_15265 [Caulobacteraceae bacterium]